ncbi:hypothetical protein HKBW3S34_02079, partial [Candidatus Hakubella thermalkaliphila]
LKVSVPVAAWTVWTEMVGREVSQSIEPPKGCEMESLLVESVRIRFLGTFTFVL